MTDMVAVDRRFWPGVQRQYPEVVYEDRFKYNGLNFGLHVQANRKGGKPSVFAAALIEHTYGTYVQAVTEFASYKTFVDWMRELPATDSSAHAVDKIIKMGQ